MADWMRFKHWSMTCRLSFYFAVSSLVLTSVMGLYLYKVLDRQLAEEHTIFLADDVEALRKSLALEESLSALSEDRVAASAMTSIGSRLHLTVFDEHGGVLTAAPAASRRNR